MGGKASEVALNLKPVPILWDFPFNQDNERAAVAFIGKIEKHKGIRSKRA